MVLRASSGYGGGAGARRLRACFGAAAVVVVVAVGGGPGALRPAEASSAGTISLVPAAVAPGATVTVTVVDGDLSVGTRRVGETVGSGGVPHELPAGGAGTTYAFRVAHVPVGDSSGDGRVGAEDVEASLAGALVANVSAESGLVTLWRMVENDSAVPFSVTYSSDQADMATVRVTSDADSVGFNLAVLETGPATGVFTGTFVVGAGTSRVNASSPGGRPRPMIAGVDGGLVSAAYSDANPLRVVSDAVRVDATPPQVIVEVPTHGAAVRTVTPWVRARVTDFGSGVRLDAIVFHVDVDRDGVFGEVGERVTPSEEESEAIRGGFIARARLPDLGADGAVEWYVTATDAAGNVGRSDANASVAGNQNHRLYVDMSPPRLLSARTGEAYDAAGGRVLTGQQESVRVVFSEALDPASANPGLFVVDGIRATEAVVDSHFPDTVWLTVPGLPSRALSLEVAAGAVRDTAGHDSAPGLTWPTDGAPPRLWVSVDRRATRGPVVVTVVADEDVVIGPMVTFNNVTVGKAGIVEELRWQLVLDAGSLPGAVGGDGVKNVQVSAFDGAGNEGRGGVDSGAARYPAGATRFELDRRLDAPVVTPRYGATVRVHDPVIEASYAAEAVEYEGDSLRTVRPVSATLDGKDVLADLVSADGLVWRLETWGLKRGAHVFTIRSVDEAGNTHGEGYVRFYVDADLPTPTPTPEATGTAGPSDEDATSTVTPGGSDSGTVVPTSTPEPPAEPVATSTPITLLPPATGRPGQTDAAAATPTATAPASGSEAVVPTPTASPGAEPTPEATPVAVPLPTPGGPPGADDGAVGEREAEPAPGQEELTPLPDAVETEGEGRREDGGWTLTATAVRDVEAEIEATVQAIRAEALAEDAAGEESEAAGSAGPSGDGSNVDFALYGLGLMGLLVAAGRARLRNGSG